MNKARVRVSEPNGGEERKREKGWKEMRETGS